MLLNNDLFYCLVDTSRLWYLDVMTGGTFLSCHHLCSLCSNLTDTRSETCLIELQRNLGWKGPLEISSSLLCKAGPTTELHQLAQLLILVSSGTGVKCAK